MRQERTKTESMRQDSVVRERERERDRRCLTGRGVKLMAGPRRGRKQNKNGTRGAGVQAHFILALLSAPNCSDQIAASAYI